MDTSVIAAGLGCFGVVVVLAIVAGVVGHRREKARKEALQAWAVRNRWEYRLAPQQEWWRHLPGKNRRGVTLALTSVLGGRPVAVGEYSYTESHTTSNADGSSSTSSTTHRFVVYVVRMRAAWPALTVRRRGGMSKLGRSLFGDRPTALGYEPFDSAYKISAERPEIVRVAFGQQLVADHVAGLLPEWSIFGDELMVVMSGRIGVPDELPGRFAPLLRIAGLLETRPA